jgi:hypothetical protein
MASKRNLLAAAATLALAGIGGPIAASGSPSVPRLAPTGGTVAPIAETTMTRPVAEPGLYRVSVTVTARAPRDRKVRLLIGPFWRTAVVSGREGSGRVQLLLPVHGDTLTIKARERAVKPGVVVDMQRVAVSVEPAGTLSSAADATGATGTTAPATASTGATGTAAPSGVPQPTGDPGAWNLAFDDEFNGTSLDTSKWVPDWFDTTGTLNNVTTDPANVSVGGGDLTLTLSSSGVGAAISTNPHAGASPGFQMGCGFIEGRVEFPGSGDTIDDWPAFWTSSQNWPTTGETDIFEGYGGEAGSNYHSGGPAQSSANIASNSGLIPGDWGGNFHVYGVDREPGENIIYWDGQVVRTYPTYDNCAPQYLLVNIGDGEGAPTVVGAQVKVDYIRAWVKSS